MNKRTKAKDPVKMRAAAGKSVYLNTDMEWKKKKKSCSLLKLEFNSLAIMGIVTFGGKGEA